jgi:hypothetical protein
MRGASAAACGTYGIKEKTVPPPEVPLGPFVKVLP